MTGAIITVFIKLPHPVFCFRVDFHASGQIRADDKYYLLLLKLALSTINQTKPPIMLIILYLTERRKTFQYIVNSIISTFIYYFLLDMNASNKLQISNINTYVCLINHFSAEDLDTGMMIPPGTISPSICDW
jgi:hypothetical protein